MPRAFVLGASFLIYHRKLYPLVLAGAYGVIYLLVLASRKGQTRLRKGYGPSFPSVRQDHGDQGTSVGTGAGSRSDEHGVAQTR